MRVIWDWFLLLSGTPAYTAKRAGSGRGISPDAGDTGFRSNIAVIMPKAMPDAPISKPCASRMGAGRKWFGNKSGPQPHSTVKMQADRHTAPCRE